MEQTLQRQEFLRRQIKQAKDHPRKAYLDTYARRRSLHGLDEARLQAKKTSAQTIKQPQIQPTDNVAATKAGVKMAVDAVSVPVAAVKSKPVVASKPKIVNAGVIDGIQKVSKQKIISDFSKPTNFVPEEQLAYTPTSHNFYTPESDKQIAEGDYVGTISARRQPAAMPASQFMQKLSAAIDEKTENEVDSIKNHMSPEKAKRLEANLDALYSQSLTEQLAKGRSNSSSHVRGIIASSLICGLLAVGIFAFVGKADTQQVVAQPVGAPVIEVESTAPSQAPAGEAPQTRSRAVAPSAVQPTDPVRVVAAKIGMNGSVERVGTNAEGAIDVPRSYGLIGWYSQSTTAGQNGPTVLVGHYTGGYGGIFDKLNGLVDGDLITVTNGKGENFTYKVTRKAEYPKDQVPMAEVVKPGDKPRLEIITCSGKWQAQDYTNRIVLTAEYVQ